MMWLTKEQAIAKHRKMWNWIADQLENPEAQKSVYDLKEEYCIRNNINILSHCFCCQYDSIEFFNDYNVKKCSNCPLKWGTENEYEDYYCEQEDGLWITANNLSKLNRFKEAAEVARQIANLPEKEE